MIIFYRQFLLTPILASALFLSATSMCAAGSYKWTDRDGSLHFSDSLPTYEVPKENLNPADPEQRPLLEKPLLIYSDKVFRLTLTAEEDDILKFDLTYTNIQRSYPETISGKVRLQICAVDRARSSTYLSYTVAPVEGGSKTFQLTNKLSKQSQSYLETESLYVFLYYDDRDRKEFRKLFTKEIPFGKIWHKRQGGVYQ